MARHWNSQEIEAASDYSTQIFSGSGQSGRFCFKVISYRGAPRVLGPLDRLPNAPTRSLTETTSSRIYEIEEGKVLLCSIFSSSLLPLFHFLRGRDLLLAFFPYTSCPFSLCWSSLSWMSSFSTDNLCRVMAILSSVVAFKLSNSLSQGG